MKYFLVLILFCSLCFGHKPKCCIWLTSISNPAKKVRLTQLTSDILFSIQDPRHKELYLNSSLDSDGRFTFSIRKITKDGSIRGDWKASDAFDLAMAHFGKRVTKIQGSWTEGEGDNSRVFLEERAKGRSNEEAAFATWTGKQAWKHGFRKIGYIGSEFADQKEEITVVFEKP